MDFALIHKGIELASVAAVALNISLSPGPSSPQNTAVQKPFVSESQNLPADETVVLQDLSSLTKSDEVNLKMVIREPDPFENNALVTVEEPPKVFTVYEPTPKPSVLASAKPVEESEKEEIPEPSKKPESSKEPVKTEEKKENKSPAPSVSAAPSSSPAAALTGSNADILFQMTNDHRAKIGKPAFEKEERLCKIAETRAPMVNQELKSGTLHKGFKEMNLPYWATENLAAYQTMKENFQFLVTDYIHRVAIESDHKYSCTACVGTSCSQIFSSFVSK